MRLLGAAALAAVINMGVAAAEAAESNHWAYLASVATYKPMAGFNHIVGPTRFVGYFLLGPHVCRVTLFEAAADDEALVVPPPASQPTSRRPAAPSSLPATGRRLRLPARRTPTSSRSPRSAVRSSLNSRVVPAAAALAGCRWGY
jgi:hypothetical protein